MDLELWRKTKRERKMTYADISEQSGLPIGTIKNIFAGYTPDPRQSTILAIEKALGIETRIERSEFSPRLSSTERILLERYRQLPSDFKQRATDYIKNLFDIYKAEKDIRD